MPSGCAFADVTAYSHSEQFSPDQVATAWTHAWAPAQRAPEGNNYWAPEDNNYKNIYSDEARQKNGPRRQIWEPNMSANIRGLGQRARFQPHYYYTCKVVAGRRAVESLQTENEALSLCGT